MTAVVLGLLRPEVTTEAVLYADVATGLAIGVAKAAVAQNAAATKRRPAIARICRSKSMTKFVR